MKYLITTRADSGVQDWIDLTHPIFKQYAERCGADFKVLDHVSDCDVGDGRWHYRIMKHKELHEQYDRILHLDTDMLLAPDCPNLFELVPYDYIGTIFEDVGSRKSHRHNVIVATQMKFGAVNWRFGYINTGTFLTSRCHSMIYEKINGEYWTEFGFDDAHMGYLIRKNNLKVGQLPFQFNHMAMFSEPWNNNPDRFKSYIIHYAGRGVFDEGVANKLEQAKLDYKRLYK